MIFTLLTVKNVQDQDGNFLLLFLNQPHLERNINIIMFIIYWNKQHFVWSLIFKSIIIGMYFMEQVLPGLFVGNYRDSKDTVQLERHKISHIVAIHDAARRLHPVSNNLWDSITFYREIESFSLASTTSTTAIYAITLG